MRLPFKPDTACGKLTFVAVSVRLRSLPDNIALFWGRIVVSALAKIECLESGPAESRTGASAPEVRATLATRFDIFIQALFSMEPA